MSYTEQSAEFASLCTTSQLPEWLDDESMLPNYWLLDMAGVHGNEQGPLQYIRSRMAESDTPPGMLPMIAHRLASDQNVRHIGASQLLDWSPGRSSWEVASNDQDDISNPEEQAAAGITWLRRQMARPQLNIDRHSNPNGDTYGIVGKRTTAAALAAAHIMGHAKVCVVSGVSYLNTFPDSLAVEEAVPADTAEKAAYYQTANEQVRKIAALGIEGLTRYCNDQDLAAQLSFFSVVNEVCIVDPITGAPNHPVLRVLSELEELSYVADPSDTSDALPWATPMGFSQSVKEQLGLADGKKYLVEGAGYHNNGMEVNLPRPILEQYDLKEQPRRLVWNTLLTPSESPVADSKSDLLIFNN